MKITETLWSKFLLWSKPSISEAMKDVNKSFVNILVVFDRDLVE